MRPDPQGLSLLFAMLALTTAMAALTVSSSRRLRRLAWPAALVLASAAGLLMVAFDQSATLFADIT